MNDDYLENLFDKFIVERQFNAQGLFNKFKGPYRAVVVETNDPLNIRRVRVRIPELHDYNLKIEECPWATIANWAGGKQCGSFHNYVIGDIVFVLLEIAHPYSPIVIASADATRRARYPLESVYCPPTPAVLNELGDIEEDAPSDYERNWLPKDKRPMSEGIKDRYGNCFIMSAVGFFPKEHENDPIDPGLDLVNKRNIQFEKGSSPVKNDPDVKHIVLQTKYGNFIILSDVGYDWKNEFSGDWDKDKEKERDRTKYYIKHFTEQESKNRDQRRVEIRTRCGHIFELRDVGWKTSRKSDPWVSATIVDPSATKFDERWVKVRTKGHHLIQMMDSGFDEKDDNKYKQLNKEQYGGKTDSEEEFWKNQDARQIRFITRHGFKLVLDDRGSDPQKAEEDDIPHGNGLLIKGKRKCGGVLRGFGIEFNEKDDMNKIAIYTPRSKIFEMNDKYNYIILCTDTVEPISEEWQYKKDNEFARKPARVLNPEQSTCHLVLDNANEYVRLKTPSQQGVEFRDGGLNCGFSCDDDAEEGSGGAPRDGFQGQRLFAMGNKCEHKTWAIFEDKEKRAFFMTYDEKAIIIHSCECCSTNCNKPIPAMWLVFDEKGEGSAGIWTKHTEPNTIIMQNLCNKIKVYAVNDIEFYTLKNFRIKAHENIEMRALKDIIWRADRDVKGSSDQMTHHWAGTDYKVKAKQNINEHALQNITNWAQMNHCIVADQQATVWSKAIPHVTKGPGAKWIVGPGIVGTNVDIHAPMIVAIVGPGPQAHVLYGSSLGDHPVGTPSTHDGDACPAPGVPHEIRIPASDNTYQRPNEKRFIVCGRKHTGNKPFTPAPLTSIRGSQGSPSGGPKGATPKTSGQIIPPPLPFGPGNPQILGYDGGGTKNPEPPLTVPYQPPPPPQPSESHCYQAIGYVLNSGNYSDWDKAREECDKAPIVEGGFGGLQMSETIVVIRGGCSISTVGVNTLELNMLIKKQSDKDIVFNIIYSYSAPVIGADFNYWYSIGEADSRYDVWSLDVSDLIGGAMNGNIYFAAVAKSDRFATGWYKIIKGVCGENWFCWPTFKFIVNGKTE